MHRTSELVRLNAEIGLESYQILRKIFYADLIRPKRVLKSFVLNLTKAKLDNV